MPTATLEFMAHGVQSLRRMSLFFNEITPELLASLLGALKARKYDPSDLPKPETVAMAKEVLNEINRLNGGTWQPGMPLKLSKIEMDLCAQGKIINAIKEMRTRTGCGLVDGKNACEKYCKEAGLHWPYSSSVPAVPVPILGIGPYYDASIPDLSSPIKKIELNENEISILKTGFDLCGSDRRTTWTDYEGKEHKSKGTKIPTIVALRMRVGGHILGLKQAKYIVDTYCVAHDLKGEAP